MKYSQPVFRPPFEADSLLLQVTVGCSHNKCGFCTMYRQVSFHMESLEQIEKDLREAREAIPNVERIFLVNADPFALSAPRLKTIGGKINEILPEVKTIAMYASILNVINKTDEELRELRDLKFNDLNIGVESGLPGMMERFNKGYDLATAKDQLARLKQAGFDFSLNFIIGGAGTELHIENGRANAALVNETKPNLVFIANLHVDPGSELYEEKMRGGFIENTIRQNLEEEIEFLEHLNIDNCTFYGLHTSNVVPVKGVLPGARQTMLTRLKKGLATIDQQLLNSRDLEKGREGNLLLPI
ncbi:radical SAM protein [Desulfosediminicola sp.]|uniref:radical SAM protein n=1 Tax=Desulfosediminicola sp. TaxID=2886825 RepID=UPI003AF2F77B